MINIRIGDARDLIKEYDDNTFDCVMTSPPYWGLRDYEHPDQIGMESTPEEYLNTMVTFFDDVKLKLKDTGTCFVNLGDTYAGKGTSYEQTDNDIKYATVGNALNKKQRRAGKVVSIKPKCLCMIPERFAWMMIEHGWILRNKIIWWKPNHMPESVTDRFTKAHEVIWFFTKNQKYDFDLDAVRLPHKTQEKRPMDVVRSRTFGYNGKYEGNLCHEDFGSPRARTQGRNENTDGIKLQSSVKCSRAGEHYNGKNPGDVWNITTKPYSGAHFAVFPLELVRKPILAGCPPGGHVLDPFGGSGTVAEFCRKSDRDCTIFELNPEYEKLIKERSLQYYPDLTSF